MPDLPGSSSSAAGSSSRTRPRRSSPSHGSQQWPGSSRSASPRQASPACGSHGYHQEKKGFRLWKLCV